MESNWRQTHLPIAFELVCELLDMYHAFTFQLCITHGLSTLAKVIFHWREIPAQKPSTWIKIEIAENSAHTIS